MPLCTQITDTNGNLKQLRWGWWHLECLEDAFKDEVECETVSIRLGYAATLFNSTPYTFENGHIFTDPTDGEVFVIQPGDTFNAWRD